MTQHGTIQFSIFRRGRNEELVRTRRVACRKTPKMFIVQYGGELRFAHDGKTLNKFDIVSPYTFQIHPDTFQEAKHGNPH